MTRAYAVPLVIAVCTALGLVAALVGDGAWDAVSWLLLAAPAAAVATGLWPK